MNEKTQKIIDELRELTREEQDKRMKKLEETMSPEKIDEATFAAYTAGAILEELGLVRTGEKAASISIYLRALLDFQKDYEAKKTRVNGCYRIIKN